MTLQEAVLEAAIAFENAIHRDRLFVSVTPDLFGTLLGAARCRLLESALPPTPQPPPENYTFWLGRDGDAPSPVERMRLDEGLERIMDHPAPRAFSSRGPHPPGTLGIYPNAH